MIKADHHIIGVMSGTSLDGVDIVYASFVYVGRWRYKIHIAETIPYSDAWRERLKNLVKLPEDALNEVDKDYTDYLGELIRSFIVRNDIKHVDAVCSHGHTALHQPEKGLTYQIGNKAFIASIINKTVVCDFRVQDVALGGQGAPLVPIGDRLLFPEYDFCLNLGGFANVSFDMRSERIAYDICPVNIVLNHYVNKLGLSFDDGGRLASEGQVHHDLLNELNGFDYYSKAYPKSLGLEWVKTNFLTTIDKCLLPIQDILRTCVEHFAIMISRDLNIKNTAKVLITGGGAYNLFLLERLRAKCNNEIVIPSKEIIEFKEALIFGFLGVLKLRNEPNCLASVTGASRDHSSGKIYRP